MRRAIPFLAFFALMIASAGSASADTACFDWSCNSSTGVCTFDLSCSEADPFIWKFRLDFGDGTTSGLTGSTQHTHTYDISVTPHPYVTLTVYPWSNNPFPTVTCQIIVANFVGPSLPTSGRCSS